jgi:hypothetical protein
MLMEDTMDKREKYEKLFEILKELKKSEFTGSLKINFTQGGVGRIEKLEEMKFKSK